MRATQRKQRLGGALLSVLLLIACLASAAHAHPVPSHSTSLGTGASGAPTGELDCALCASGARLAHGILQERFAPPAVPSSRLAIAHLEARAPRPTDLRAPLARAPPRNR